MLTAMISQVTHYMTSIFQNKGRRHLSNKHQKLLLIYNSDFFIIKSPGNQYVYFADSGNAAILPL